MADKTLVAWVSPANLSQAGGSVLTVSDAAVDHFDGIVFGELRARTWMPGSNGFTRTERNQSNWPPETTSDHDFVQIAIIYQGSEITVCRNGKAIAQYAVSDPVPSFDGDIAVLIGPRRLSDGVECFAGRVRDARIYSEALNPDVIAAMQPGVATLGHEPWAWWDFASTGICDRAGRFTQTRLLGNAKVVNGCLVLDGDNDGLIATVAPATVTGALNQPVWNKATPVPASVVESTRRFREKLLADQTRPRYHFVVPDGDGMPGDPNGCFYANGRYHLMYLYHRVGSGYCWGHASSSDLLNWRHHPDAIGPGDGDEGCFSGGAFVDDDGDAYLSYWMLHGAKGIGLAKSNDRHYEEWQKSPANPVIKSTEWGITETTDASGKKLVYGSADPSNIWKKDGKYYMVAGNLPVLNKYGRETNSPAEMRGDHLYLFESENLTDWQYKGEFYERNPAWTHDSEDNMCPSFLPLPSSAGGGPSSGKHLLLNISHNMGCQYFVGTYDKGHDKFLPESHGRMTLVDSTYFAPEALVDDRGRQIMWAWLVDNPATDKDAGWSGVYGLPRTLWLNEDGGLGMRPVPEIEKLRNAEQSWNNVAISDSKPQRLEIASGDSFELQLTVKQLSADCVGVKVRATPDGEEETLIYYDAKSKTLCLDSTHSGTDGRKVLEQAPLALKPGEPLRLRIFVDKCVVEVFANDRQAICRRVYPSRADSTEVELFATGGIIEGAEIKAWEMMPANPY